MNIISNNCLSGYIYRDILKEEYQNPFIWTRLDNLDLINLLENFDIIKFENVELFKESNKLEKFRLRIDNKIKLQFNHYLFDQKYDKPTVIGIDVHYNKIWEYIVAVYLRRLKRMQKSIDFIFIEDNDTYDIDKIIKIAQVKKIKTFIITNKKPSFESTLLKIVPHIKYKNFMAHFYKDYYKNEIKKFLGIK